MHSREILLKRLETFALQHGLHEKSAQALGTVFRGGSYSVSAEFPDFDFLVVEIAREETIGGVPFVVTIPVSEFARVIGDKRGVDEHDAVFQMRILESYASSSLAGDHSIEAQMHRRVRRAVSTR
jgi:hypothetical protein